MLYTQHWLITGGDFSAMVCAVGKHETLCDLSHNHSIEVALEHCCVAAEFLKTGVDYSSKKTVKLVTLFPARL